MARAQGTFNFSANFETLVSGTLDARQMVDNFADLLNFTSSNFIKNGFFVAVSGEVNPSERGLYYCNNANDLSSATSWTKLSTSESSFSGDYNDLTNKPTLFSGSYNDLTDTPTLFSGNYTDLTNKPVLFSGAYSDLTGKPTLFSGSYNDLTDTPNLFSGDYNDLSNIPATFNVADDSITEPKLSPDVRTKLNETVGAGGYAANVYFSNAISTTDANYRQLSYEDDATATIIDTVVNNNEVIVDEFIFDGDALIDKIPSGVWSFNSYTKVSQENAVTKLRFEVFTRQSGGGETVLFSFDSQEINNITFEMISNQVSKPSYTINPTDKLGVKVYANTTRTSNVTVSFEIGNGNASYANAPLQIRHSQLRGTDEPNSHPISAITGLQSELDSKEESFTKNTAFNKDFGTTSDTVAEGNDSRITNGQTAFSWGDHSIEGYLTSFTETDPTVPSHVKAITTGEITNWNAAYNEKINSLTITGDANKTVTLTQQDGTTLTANFNDNNDGNGTDIKINTLDFNTTNGILTAIRDDAVEVTTDLDGRYSLLNHTHTISEIVDFPTDVSFFNNDAGYITTFTDTYVIDSTFNNSNGILSLERNNGLPTITVDLDGRYSQTDTTYSPGTGLSLVGTTFNIDNPFNPNGDYTSLRARATTATDVGLGNLPNWTSGTFDSRYVNTSGNESISGVKTFTDDILLNNSTYLQAKKDNGTNTRIHGINGSDLEYIGSIDSVVSSTLIGNNTNTVKFRVNNTDRMVINSSGNVGIGTTSPDTNLHIASTGTAEIRIEGDTNNSGDSNTQVDARLSFRHDGGSEGWNIEAINRSNNNGFLTFNYEGQGNGNVGIGTSTPSSKLDVNGIGTFRTTDNIGTNIDTLKVDGFGILGNRDNIYITNSNSNGNIKFGTGDIHGNTSEKMIITSNGNVGINTDNPQTKLHAVGNNPSSLPSLGTAGTAATIGQFSYGTQFSTLNTGKGYIQQSRTDGSTSVYDLLLQPQGGNVGIGITSADEKLVVAGNLRIGFNNYFKAGDTWIRDNGGGISVISQNDSGGGSIFFRPQGDGNGTNEMTLDSSGNLEVNGTAYFRFRSNSYYYDESGNPLLYFGNPFNGNAAIFRASGNGQEFSWRSSGNTVLATLDADNGDFETDGDVIAFSSSDRNLKENISNIDNPVEKIKALNGVYFDWIESDTRHNHKGKDVGVIAQEVESIIPEIVTTRDNGVKAVQYDKLIPLTIEAIKEQDKKIEDLETRLEKLEKLIK